MREQRRHRAVERGEGGELVAERRIRPERPHRPCPSPHRLPAEVDDDVGRIAPGPSDRHGERRPDRASDAGRRASGRRWPQVGAGAEVHRRAVGERARQPSRATRRARDASRSTGRPAPLPSNDRRPGPARRARTRRSPRRRHRAAWTGRRSAAGASEAPKPARSGATIVTSPPRRSASPRQYRPDPPRPCSPSTTGPRPEVQTRMRPHGRSSHVPCSRVILGVDARPRMRRGGVGHG